MATDSSSSSSSPSDRSSPFRVTTREVSADFSTVGPDQSAHDLGALSEAAFRTLIEKFAAIAPVKLIDGDPQLVVTAKRGRFFVLPSNGKLLLRSANDPQQPYLKFEPAELPAFLQGSDLQVATDAPPQKNFQTLIGTGLAVAADRAANIPPSPSAPIYGSFPERRATLAASGVVEAHPGPLRPLPERRGPLGRNLIIALSMLFLAVASGSLWVLFGPTTPPKPLPPGPPTEFAPIRVPEQLTSLKQRTLGTYATSGEGGERLLELREDGTFHYQVFGSNLARTINRKGTYTFALRHGTDDVVLRTNGLGTIEVRDEKNLSFEQVLFTRLP